MDKPAGMTSHDVVARARKLLSERRIGHSGTLDPDATGVLLLGVGSVTRLLRFLTALGKSYTGEVVFGSATDTLDASGTVTATYEMPGLTLERVRAAAAGLTGEIDQIPPMVSAVSVGGRRLHELAREGIEIEREARRVTVRRFDVDSMIADPAHPLGVFPIAVDCSSGTYVRTLAADLGTALGGGAHLRNLRRTSIGSFGLDEAVALDELDREALLTPMQALRDYPAVDVDARTAALVATGRILERDLGFDGAGPWAVRDGAGRLLAVYELHGERVKPAVVLPADDLG